MERKSQGLLVAGLLCGLICLGMGAAENDEIIVVEQDYNIIEQGKGGPTAKDIRQRLYLASKWVRIDEFAGAGRVPTETYLINFESQEIVNLDNENATKKTEKFEARRKRIDERKEGILKDLEAMRDGPQKRKTEELYRALLDDKRKYKHLQEKDLKKREAKELKKEICGTTCDLVWVIDSRKKDYVPLKAYLHPEIKVAYDSAEVLYLLQLIGSKMSNYLQKHKDIFHRLPMEMHLNLAAGGTLDTKVVSVKRVKRSELDPSIHQVPAGYKERRKRKPPAAVVPVKTDKGEKK